MVKRKKMSPREFEFVISSYYDDSKKIYITYYVIRIEVIYWFLHKLAVLPNTERKRERFAEANRAKQRYRLSGKNKRRLFLRVKDCLSGATTRTC